jgi:putative hydrolase of the HAD superfamily
MGDFKPSQRVIIWDFEGTLAVRPGRFTAALVKAARLCDPAFRGTDDQVRPHLSGAFPWHGKEKRHAFADDADAWWESLQGPSARALRQFGMREAVAVEAARLARSIYLDSGQWACLDGALQTLDALSECGWTHVVMSNFAPELDGIVEALGLSSRIAMAFSSGRVGFEKPSKAYFDHVLEWISPAQAFFMIGDNPEADIEGGRSAGLKTILLGDTDSSADFRVDRLSAILEIADFSDSNLSRGDHHALATAQG